MANKRLGLVIGIVVIVIVAIVAGIVITDLTKNSPSSQSSTPSTSSPSEQPAVHGTAVTIQNMAFMPPALTAKVGQTITWINNDNVAHTVTSDSGAPAAFDSGTLNPGKTFHVTFTKAGTYHYHCSIHPNMHGAITITQ